jgi:hypothetical protein
MQSRPYAICRAKFCEEVGLTQVLCRPTSISIFHFPKHLLKLYGTNTQGLVGFEVFTAVVIIIIIIILIIIIIICNSSVVG